MIGKKRVEKLGQVILYKKEITFIARLIAENLGEIRIHFLEYDSRNYTSENIDEIELVFREIGAIPVKNIVISAVKERFDVFLSHFGSEIEYDSNNILSRGLASLIIERLEPNKRKILNLFERNVMDISFGSFVLFAILTNIVWWMDSVDYWFKAFLGAGVGLLSLSYSVYGFYQLKSAASKFYLYDPVKEDSFIKKHGEELTKGLILAAVGSAITLVLTKFFG